MNRTLCAHCGKEMAREENKVYLEVRPSLKKSIIFLEMHL
jgi:phage FluMu protein Com